MEKIKRTISDDKLEMIDNHPAFGVAELKRVTTLDGYEISLVFHNAERRINLKNRCINRYTRGVPVLEVRFTPYEFMSLISSVVYGSPCLFYRIGGKLISGIEERYKDSNVLASIEQDTVSNINLMKDDVEITKCIDNIKSILEQPAIKRSDKNSIVSYLNRILNRVTGHLPYVLDTYRELIDQVKLNALCDIDVMVKNAIELAGLDAIKQKRNGSVSSVDEYIEESYTITVKRPKNMTKDSVKGHLVRSLKDVKIFDLNIDNKRIELVSVDEKDMA